MLGTSRSRLWHRLRLVAAALGFVAQGTLVLAAIAEGREGIGAAAHVEQSGTRAHYAHEPATCAACQARSIHSTTATPFAPNLGATPYSSAPRIGVEQAPFTETFPDHNPRAPPVM